MRKALFAGSFDPFTLGHKSITDRALNIADEVVIAIGINADKKTMFSTDERMQYINRVYADNPRVKVMHYEGLTTDLARQIDASFLVRGVRSIKDFENERQIADVNRCLNGIETVLLLAEERYASISSTIIRELLTYDKDVSQFLPIDIKIK